MKQTEGSKPSQSEGAYTLCVKVAGMTCPACERALKRALLKISGVRRVEVSFATGQVRIASSRKVSRGEVQRALKGSPYTLAAGSKANRASYIAVAVVVAAYFILKGAGHLWCFSFFPQATESTTLAALLAVGFLTSFHCVAMCGGLNLSQSNLAVKSGHSPLVSNLAYQAGRLVSYTSIGAVVGLLGSVIALSSSVQGAVMIAAGLLMAVCALNIFGVGGVLRHLAPRLPAPVSRLLELPLASKGSFVLGLVNGFMPCGPLQSMQIYALGTGSAARGAASMFVFCLGTVPLLFAMGFAAARMSKRFSRLMMRASAAAILLMALSTAGRGLSLAGGVLPFGGARGAQVSAARRENEPVDKMAQGIGNTSAGGGGAAKASDLQGAQRKGAAAKASDGSSGDARERVQRVASTASFRGFEPITVVRGVPVEWTLTVPDGQLTGCNAALVIPEYRLKTRLKEGDNLITFTPKEAGTFVFSCWMGMITSYITVVDA